MIEYILNILPTRILHNKIPTKILFHRVPSYDHLQCFSYLCYPNLFSTALYKLAPRSTPCTFLDIPSNHRGYLYYDMSTHKIIVSHHVTFDENVFSFSKPHIFRKPNYSFLDDSKVSPIFNIPLSHHTVSRDPAIPPASELDPNGNTKVEVVDERSGVITSGTPTKKLEMKMSKKISITGIPTTVKELFKTGLLEGYPVFYNGGNKGIPLRGTIKDIGILCSCDLCKGTTVVPPSKFEIHACNSYRRASEYICLENGKSLLDVVKECRKGSLKTLEETIQCVIGPVHVKRSLICRDCNGSFVTTLAGKDEQLCDSCIISLRSEATPTQYTENGVFEPVLNLNSSGTSNMSSVSLRSIRGRKKKKAVIMHSRRQSPSLHTLSRKKWKTPNKLTKPVFTPKSDGTATMCSSFRNNMQGNISEKLSKSVAVSKYSKVALPGVSMHSGTQWKMTKRDQKMHKLVFEEGGLPEGTEVAYYSRGKKLLVGYKKGSGIFCSCCNTEAVDAVPDDDEKKHEKNFKCLKVQNQSVKELTRTLILVDSGTYREKVVINSNKTNLIIQGQGYLNTAISWDDTANSTGGTANSFTVAIYASNFIAYNICFQDSIVWRLRVFWTRGILYRVQYGKQLKQNEVAQYTDISFIDGQQWLLNGRSDT